MVEIKEKWFVRNSPTIGGKFREFQEIFSQTSALDPKTKELLLTTCASIFRCRHCTEAHIKKALEAGASKEEITEALLIAALEGAGTQLNWAKDVFEQYL